MGRSNRAIEAAVEADINASLTPAQLQAKRDAKEQAAVERIVRRRRAIRDTEEHQELVAGMKRREELEELFEPRTARQFVETAPQHEWLVEGIFIDGQPALLGGPKKTYKTSIAVDLALSIASGTPFLGTFRVPKPRPVVLASGESGAATLAETIRRVVSARRLDDAVLDNVQILTTLPNFSDEASINALVNVVEFLNPVLIIDPLYRCFGQGEINTADLVRMGGLLSGFVSTMRDSATTPIYVDANGNECKPGTPGAEPGWRYLPSTVILVHHAKKNTWGRRALEMDDLAFAGVSEFTRQWFLVNWRAPFRPAEPKRLIVAHGGSAGHSGQFALTIDEGRLATDFTGRTWLTTVQSVEEARRADKEQREQDKQGGAANRRTDTLLAALPDDGSRVSYSQAKRAMGCNPRAADRAIETAVAAGLIGHERIGNRRFVWSLGAEQTGGQGSPPRSRHKGKSKGAAVRRIEASDE